jgi:hypothetical protein
VCAAPIEAAGKIKFRGNSSAPRAHQLRANSCRRPIKFRGHRSAAVELIQVPGGLGRRCTGRTGTGWGGRGGGMARSRSGDRTEETPRPLRPLHPFRRGVREGGGGGGGGGREGGRKKGWEMIEPLDVPISRTVPCPASWHPSATLGFPTCALSLPLSPSPPSPPSPLVPQPSTMNESRGCVCGAMRTGATLALID